MSAPDATPVTQQNVTERDTRGRPTRNQPSGILGTHPMRERIINAIIEGKQTTRQIAEWTVPHVTHATIARMAQQVKRELLAAHVLDKAQQMQSVASIISTNGVTPEKVTALAAAGKQHLSRIERILAPLEKQVTAADKDNDRSGLSTVAKTALQAIRLQAELDGSLATASPASTTNNYSVVLLPTVINPEDDGETIDVPVEPL